MVRTWEGPHREKPCELRERGEIGFQGFDFFPFEGRKEGVWGVSGGVGNGVIADGFFSDGVFIGERVLEKDLLIANDFSDRADSV